MTIHKEPDMSVDVEEISVEEYKEMFFDTFQRNTTISDAAIIEMVRRSDDDMDPEDWAKFMLAIEIGDDLNFMNEYNEKLSQEVDAAE